MDNQEFHPGEGTTQGENQNITVESQTKAADKASSVLNRPTMGPKPDLEILGIKKSSTEEVVALPEAQVVSEVKEEDAEEFAHMIEVETNKTHPGEGEQNTEDKTWEEGERKAGPNLEAVVSDGIRPLVYGSDTQNETQGLPLNAAPEPEHISEEEQQSVETTSAHGEESQNSSAVSDLSSVSNPFEATGGQSETTTESEEVHTASDESQDQQSAVVETPPVSDVPQASLGESVAASPETPVLTGEQSDPEHMSQDPVSSEATQPEGNSLSEGDSTPSPAEESSTTPENLSDSQPPEAPLQESLTAQPTSTEAEAAVVENPQSDPSASPAQTKESESGSVAASILSVFGFGKKKS
jgi:hypothetical protein